MLINRVCTFGKVSVPTFAHFPLKQWVQDVKAEAMPQPSLKAEGTYLLIFSFRYRGGRDWTEHSQRLEEHQERAWPGMVEAGTAGREHARWLGMG